jgi:hypothetical protein
MKRFLLICFILITAGSLVAQTPTVASLTTTSGSNIQWYSASTGGSPLATSTALVNGTTYYASQTVNGVESATRLATTATVSAIPIAPSASTHVSTLTQIDWKWSAVSGATGYKWSTTNDYSTATDLGNVLIKTESGLSCGTVYNRYIWAYNTTTCGSVATTLSQTTSSCGWTGGLTSYRGNINSEYDFSVTGTTTGSVWGCSNLYTDDSALQTTAVHAGYVNNGQTKTVRVRILAGQSSYSGCTQNGVTSTSYTSWEGSYQIVSSW